MIELATPKVTKSKQIRMYVASNPKAKSADVAKALGVTPAYVSTVMWNAKKKAKAVKKVSGMQKKKVMTDKTTLSLPKPNWKQLGLFSSNVSIKESLPDPVNHPAHYKVGGIETIDFIEAKKLGYNLGNVVKYLTRADHKANKLQDLRKAQWYLEREIYNVENNKKTA